MTERRLVPGAADSGPGESEPGIAASEAEPLAAVPLRGRPRRQVLFALTELEYPTPALRRVAAVATALDGELCILRVLSPSAAQAPRPHEAEARSLEGERSRLALQGTAAWWGRTLLQPSSDENIRVRIGDFVDEVSACARSIDAACVILAPTPAGWGGALTALLRSCRRPVFATPVVSQQWAALLTAARRASSP